MSASGGPRRVLMLVWTSVATDTRVLREAAALVSEGYTVHIIGRAVPADFDPPTGITVDSVGRPPLAQSRSRRLTAPERLGRWLLLRRHVHRRMVAWQDEATQLARDWVRDAGTPEVVHAHDYSALPVGDTLAEEWGVPLVYDTHEYWVGRPLEGLPAPRLLAKEAADEGRLGARAAAVITVGDGVARALRNGHGDWPEITVVRNTFPWRDTEPSLPEAPRGLVYAGRLAAYRELEVAAAASRQLDLPVELVGPADEAWLRGFDPGAATVLPAEPLEAVDARLSRAGVSLVTHSDRWENHRLALPNKLFHAVSLGVPVVATDVGELGAIVREYELGVLYAPGDPVSFVRAARALIDSYAAHAASVARARRTLTWEHDATRLVDRYRAIRSPG